MNNGLPVFVWTLRRKWKGLAIFLGAIAVLIFVVINVYPEFSELRGKAIAEVLGGDIEVSLTRNDKRDGEYTLRWSKFGGADGYVVVQSEAEIPLSLARSIGVSEINIALLSQFLPGDGTASIHPFDATTTQVDFTIPKGREGGAVYFGVLAYKGSVSRATIEGTSETVNTRDLVRKGAYDKLMENPFMKAFVGDTSLDIYSIKGFLSIELFNSLTLYLIIYFLIQYAGAFSSEMEKKTIDILLSTPLTRRRFFISRYLSWVAMDLILVICWTTSMYLSVLSIGESGNASFIDIGWTMVTFLPFLLSVQGFCMLVSVATNDPAKAYGMAFGIYYGMFVLRVIALLSKRLNFLKYITLEEYWDPNTIFVRGVVPWGGLLVLSGLSIGLFFAGLAVFEKKDLAY